MFGFLSMPHKEQDAAAADWAKWQERLERGETVPLTLNIVMARIAVLEARVRTLEADANGERG